MGLRCKRCGSEEHVKNGLMRNKQRYLCKGCGLNFTVSVASENGSEELRIAPVCRARSLEQARERRPERLSAEAALLELLAAATGARIVAPHTLERVNKTAAACRQRPDRHPPDGWPAALI